MSDKLEALLGRLPRRSEADPADISFTGRALSRSDDELHVATRGGVVAIPISQIKDVQPRFEDDPALVALTLHDASEIRVLRRARRPRFQEHPDLPPIVIIGPGVNTTVCTTTYTGEGDEAMCDDDGCVDHDDDLAQ